MMATLARDSRLFLKIAGVSFFDYVFLISVFATLIIIAINGSGRIRYNDIIEDKKKVKGAANAQQKSQIKVRKPKDILSIRFGGGYKKRKSQNASDSSDDDDDQDEYLLSNYGSNLWTQGNLMSIFMDML